MSALIAWVLSNPVILAAIAGVIGMFGVGVQQRRAGARREREKQAADELRARNVADKVNRDVDALPSDQARKELREWSKR